MRKLKNRTGKGFEIQFYDDETGNNSFVIVVATAEELAQYLARCCWGHTLGKNPPSVWKNGEKWCFGEYSPVREYDELMTNREYLIRSLDNPNWRDDGGASYDSWLHYHISCPYFSGDTRAHCHGKPDGYIDWDNCNACKEEWLDKEVDI